ncbi:MAG: hypothetical protein KAI28_09775 [Sphingomonadales bacterium]|nr:hypothetical protein [Sphingomonadales bacterium]
MEIRSNPAALSAYAGQVKNQQQQNRFQVQKQDETSGESTTQVTASVQEQLKTSSTTQEQPTANAQDTSRREAPFGVDSDTPKDTRPGQVLDISV